MKKGWQQIPSRKKNHRKLPIRHSKMIIFQTVRARSQLWILKTIKEMKLTFFSRFCLVASNFFSVFSSGRVFLWSGVHSVNQNGDHDEVTERNGTSERMKEKKNSMEDDICCGLFPDCKFTWNTILFSTSAIFGWRTMRNSSRSSGAFTPRWQGFPRSLRRISKNKASFQEPVLL